MGMSSGVAMCVHFCMGKKSGVDFYSKVHTDKNKCSKCGMTEKDDCCKNEYSFLKIQDSHKIGSVEYKLDIPIVAILSIFGLSSTEIINSVGKQTISSFSPPTLFVPRRSILFCVFRL